jgi:uncharacterized membrane protein
MKPFWLHKVKFAQDAGRIHHSRIRHLAEVNRFLSTMIIPAVQARSRAEDVFAACSVIAATRFSLTSMTILKRSAG